MKLPPPPFSKNVGLIVGVSGGSDSTALLTLLASQKEVGRVKIMAAHVNYGLRGMDSLRDEQWVRNLCARLGVALRVLKVSDFRKKNARSKKSLQEAAREIRYGFFQKMAAREKAWGVAVAHHREDQAETVLDRLLRGTGPRGLSGLKLVQPLSFVPGLRDLRVWRPLLSFSREELRLYLKSVGIPWREDASNRKKIYRRNQIRHEVLPFLSKWNPRLSESLAKLGEITLAEDRLLEELLDKSWKNAKVRFVSSGIRFKAGYFKKLPLALKRRWTRRAAERVVPEARGLSFDRVEETLQRWETSRKGPWDMGFGLCAGADKGDLFLRRNLSGGRGAVKNPFVSPSLAKRKGARL